MSPDFQINTQHLNLKIIEACDAPEFAQLVQSSQSLFPWVDWCHDTFSIVEAEKLHYTIHQAADEKSAVETILELLKDEKQVLGWDFEKIGLNGLKESLAKNDIHLTQSANQELRYGITGVDTALAATGSIVLASGAGKARVASLLPPIHIAVLRSEQIVRDLETWVALQQDFGEASNIVVISGPSKTADIAMELVLGMHGPQEVHLVLIEG